MARKRVRRTVASGKRNQSGAKNKSKSTNIGATSRGSVNRPTGKKSAHQRFNPNSPISYRRLTDRQRDTYNRASAVLADLRRSEGSFSALCQKHDINPRTARQYLGRDLIGKGKKIRAAKSDKRIRELFFPLPQGDLPVQTRNSRDATRLSRFYQDRNKFLRGKLTARAFEAKWRGVRVAGQQLFADTDGISQMATAGILKIENLYASTGGAR